RTAPLALVLVMLAPGFVSLRGMVLAVACGAITSGLGYAVWYAALKGLTATRAATVQLAIPLLAAAGGLMILREPISRELVISAGLILGGIGLAIAVRANVAAQHPPNGPRET
ncbi:MAG: EamA family transporter, partial [Planctomycetaceae bacterium]